MNMPKMRALVSGFSILIAVSACAATDVTRPTVAVTAPTKAQKVVGGTNAQFTVRGTAKDLGGVAAVWFRLNDDPFAAAVTTNGWKNWSMPVTLAVGTNSVRAYSVDLSGNVSPTQSVTFTYAALGVPIAEFAKWPENKAFGFKAVSGTWSFLDALPGLYNVSPAKGAGAAMQSTLAGPGILSFSWQLAGGDGTNALTCAVGVKTLATNKVDGVTLPGSVAVPAGAQTVKWTVTRGKVSGEAKGVISDVSWTPLLKADTPVPENGQVLMRRNLSGLSWNTTGEYCRVYAGLTAKTLKPVGLGIYSNATVPAGDIDALVTSAAGKPVYWRVDTVMRDGDGREAVNTGAVWSFAALPEGSPEFTIVQSESDSLMVGVRAEVGPYEVTSGPTGTLSCAVKAGVLPTGIKVEVRDGAVYATGVPSKKGSYQAVVQLTMKTNAVTIAGTTMALRFEVSALPAWAWGSFSGYTADDELGGGAASMSVTALGKVTGKIAIAGSNYSFSAVSYLPGEADELLVETSAKSGRAALPLTLTVWPTVDAEEEAGAFQLPNLVEGAFNANGWVSMYRYVWKDAGMAAVATNYTGYYTSVLPGGEECGSGYLAFTVDRLGGVKAAGKLADGTAVSQSGSLVLDDLGRVYTVLYTSPVAYKGGSLFGLAEFARVEEGGPMVVCPVDGAPFVWGNFNPQATAEYGEGFSRELDLSGGWYNTLLNLRSYYTNGVSVGGVGALPALLATVKITDYDPDSESDTPPKISWTEPTVVEAVEVSPNGLALSVTPALGSGIGLAGPKAPTLVKSTDPDTGEISYNYEATNSVGLTVAFTRATGLFKGAFNVYYDYVSADDLVSGKQTWLHTVKKASYEGLLTPVREDTSDGVAGRGFFIWPDKSSYDTGRVNSFGDPIMVPFAFNGSYDFLLFAN